MKKEEECVCDDVDVKKWHLKEHRWENKPFYTARLYLFLHVPLNMRSAIENAVKGIEEKGYRLAKPFFMLEKEESWFSAKLMVAIEKPLGADENIEFLSGTFVSKSYVGPYKNLAKETHEFINYLDKTRGTRPHELFFWYTNCPKCAKKQGGSKTVIFAKIK